MPAMPVPVKPEPGRPMTAAPSPALASASTLSSTPSPWEGSRAFRQAKASFASPSVFGENRPAFTSSGRASSALPTFGAGLPSSMPAFGAIIPSSSTLGSGADTLSSGVRAFGRSVLQSGFQKTDDDRTQSERFSHDHILDFGTKITAVRVGIQPDHVDFTVHENLLARSPYFANALKCTNPNTAYITVAAQNPSAFGIYVQWLYSGRLHTKYTEKGPSTASQSTYHREWLYLTDVYLLGEYLSDDTFRDIVIDAMLEWFHEAPPNDRGVLLNNASEVYRNVPHGGPLRCLVSDIAAWHFDNGLIQEMALRHACFHLPTDFVADTLGKLSLRFQGPGVASFGNDLRSPVIVGRGSCKYHGHGEKECYKKK